MFTKRNGRIINRLPIGYIMCPKCHQTWLYLSHEYENGDDVKLVKCKCGFNMDGEIFFAIVYDAVTSYKEYMVDYYMKKKW